MTKKEKHAAYLGIILFLLAAIFSISLILGLLDFGHSNGNIFYLFGKKLINSYGFCSILIPIYTLTAGIFCFSAKWNLQKAVALLISPIPFFTLAIAERSARKIAATDISSVAFMKIIFLVLIAILLALAEYLLAFIISAKIYAKKHNPKISADNSDEFADSAELKNETNLEQSKNSNFELSDDFAKKFDEKFDEENLEENDFSDSAQEISAQEINQELEENNFENSNDNIWSLDDEGNVKTQTFQDEFSQKSENLSENSEIFEENENPTEDFENFTQEAENSAKNFENPQSQTQNFSELEENFNPQNKENSAEFEKNQNPQNAEETKYFDDPWNVTGNLAETTKIKQIENPQIENPEKDYTQTLSSIFNKEQTKEQKNSDDFSENADEFNDDLDFDNIISSFEKDSIGFEENFGEDESKNQEIHYEINFDEDDADETDAFDEKSGASASESGDFSKKTDTWDEKTDDFAKKTETSASKTANFSAQSDAFSSKSTNSDEKSESSASETDFDDIFYTDDNNSDENNAFSKKTDDEDLDNAINMALDLDEAESFADETDAYASDDANATSCAPSDAYTKKTDGFTNESENSAEKTANFPEKSASPAEQSVAFDNTSEILEEKSQSQKDKTIDFSDLKNQNSSESNFSSLDEIFSKMDEDARQKVESEVLEEKSENPQNQQNQNLNTRKTAVITDENGNTKAIPLVPQKKRGPYQISTELLTKYEENPYWEIDGETKEAAKSLQETLAEFNIEAEVIAIRKGPVVTMFEILPAPGVNLNKIRSLQDNIALRLAAKSVRIVAPIPGKKAVGIEIPNKKRAVVSFRECIEENRPEWKKMQIPVVLGKDIEGTTQIMDLAKTPHLLIAGATGAGKSVCVNSMILSILYKRSPSDVKLILIDPKIVELSLYNGIGHLLTPVITEPKAAMQALNYCICEMERRYAVLKGMGCREIVGYNQKIKEQHIATEKLPYIIIVIDEFADLMATAGKQMEAAIARLAAKSRAVGIHLVLATQRPSVDVITGLIKANIPSRIAFMVASRTDSNIIIDKTGAEKLLGKGDMLYSSASDPFPIRIQGTLVSDKEVENVVDAVKDCWGEPDYIDDEIFIDDEEDENSEQTSLFNDGADDPLYEKALDIVIQAGKASASYIQRKLSIGYNRAARLVELMEERGIVGPANGSKPREIIHIP